MSLFDKQIERILLYSSRFGVYQPEHALLKLIEDTNTRVAAYKRLQSFGINDINIVSCRCLQPSTGKPRYNTYTQLTVTNVSDKLETSLIV